MNQPDHQFRVVMRGYDPADVDRAIAGLQRGAAEPRPSAARVRVPVAAGQRLGRGGRVAAEPPCATTTSASASARSWRSPRRRPPSCASGPTPRPRTSRKHADQAAVARARRGRPVRRPAAPRRRPRGRAGPRRRPARRRRGARRRRARRRRPPTGGRGDLRAAAGQRRPGRRRLRDHPGRAPRPDHRRVPGAAGRHPGPARRHDRSGSRRPALAAQREQEAAEAEARRIVHEAEERAATLVREARAAADRVRTDSDRELAAATQRRDSINAQLTNVRQMLATLSGSAAGFAVDPLPDGGPGAGCRGSGAGGR